MSWEFVQSVNAIAKTQVPEQSAGLFLHPTPLPRMAPAMAFLNSTVISLPKIVMMCTGTPALSMPWLSRVPSSFNL